MSSPSASTSQQTQAPTPQRRISKACDACQARKVRCIPVDQTSTNSSPTCEVCLKKGTICTFEAERKKRGPVPRSTARPLVRRPPVPILAKKVQDAAISTSKRKRSEETSVAHNTQYGQTHEAPEVVTVSSPKLTNTLHDVPRTPQVSSRREFPSLPTLNRA
jgi:hypothetical protein